MMNSAAPWLVKIVHDEQLARLSPRPARPPRRDHGRRRLRWRLDRRPAALRPAPEVAADARAGREQPAPVGS
jgi:hypothetical protein